MLEEKQIKSLYSEIAKKLTNFLVASGSTYPVACDIVQETFIKLWQIRDRLSSEDYLSSFAFTIAKNLRIDYIRKHSQEIQADEMDDAALGVTNEEDQRTEGEVEYLRKRLKQALDKLSDDLRETYVMFQVGDLSIKEIAEQTGVSESLVKVRIHRAKEKLRELLKDLKDF